MTIWQTSVPRADDESVRLLNCDRGDGLPSDLAIACMREDAFRKRGPIMGAERAVGG